MNASGGSKQTLEMVSYVLCDCWALAALRFGHLGHHFFTSGSLYQHPHQQGTALCSKCGAAHCLSTGLNQRSETVEVQGSLQYPP